MEDLSGKNIEEIRQIYAAKKAEYDSIEESCLKEGLSWEMAENRLRECAKELWSLKQEERLLQEPEITFGRDWKGQTIDFQKFINLCKNGKLKDSDGYGYYATDKGKSDILIYPSDILFDKYRKDFSNVIWFSK